MYVCLKVIEMIFDIYLVGKWTKLENVFFLSSNLNGQAHIYYIVYFD